MLSHLIEVIELEEKTLLKIVASKLKDQKFMDIIFHLIFQYSLSVAIFY